MKLYRSKDGSRYHTEECRFAKPDMEWRWARDKTEREVWEAWQFGCFACKACNPLGDKSGQVES